jgi:predicted nuclease with TOPRIM domain
MNELESFQNRLKVLTVERARVAEYLEKLNEEYFRTEGILRYLIKKGETDGKSVPENVPSEGASPIGNDGGTGNPPS